MIMCKEFSKDEYYREKSLPPITIASSFDSIGFWKFPWVESCLNK